MMTAATPSRIRGFLKRKKHLEPCSWPLWLWLTAPRTLRNVFGCFEFVHSGMLHLVLNVAALAQIGLILERLVGSLAFLAVYVTAGIFANLLNVRRTQSP